jgi:hypothetical protein
MAFLAKFLGLLCILTKDCVIPGGNQPKTDRVGRGLGELHDSNRGFARPLNSLP